MKPVEIEFFIDNKTKSGVNEIIAGFDKTDNKAEALRNKIAMVEKQLSDLQQQAEQGIDIGSSGSESVDALRAKLAKLQEELKNVNKTAVSTKMIPPEIGAIKTKFNGLNMSIQQIARELPSLAMGPQMFFLAISNNLPIFADQLELARKEFQAITATGDKAVPVWKQVLSSIVSWQTALAVGITLSVTYGKEIGNWVKNLFSAGQKLKSMEESIRDVNRAIIEGNSGIGEQTTTFKTLQLQWIESGRSASFLNKFIEENKESLEKLGISINDVNDADNIFVKNSESVLEALNLRAQAMAAQKLAIDTYEKAAKKRFEIDEKIKEGVTEAVTYRAPSTGYSTPYTFRHREYTEEEKEEMYKEVDVLNAQAKAYLNIGNAKKKEASDTLKANNIKEQKKYNKKKIRQSLT